MPYRSVIDLIALLPLKKNFVGINFPAASCGEFDPKRFKKNYLPWLFEDLRIGPCSHSLRGFSVS